MKTVETILRDYDARLIAANAERARDELPRLPKVELRVLGQMSLFADPAIRAALPLVATADFDATLDGDWATRSLLNETLKQHGLVYDELSAEIWVPPGATFTLVYETPQLRAEALNPLYALLSKAIKAPDRNRVLVRAALALFGDELATLIRKHGGSPEYFLDRG